MIVGSSDGDHWKKIVVEEVFGVATVSQEQTTSGVSVLKIPQESILWTQQTLSYTQVFWFVTTIVKPHIESIK